MGRNGGRRRPPVTVYVNGDLTYFLKIYNENGILQSRLALQAFQSFQEREKKLKRNVKKIKNNLDEAEKERYNITAFSNGLSPNGKATDSDSVISRFESL